MPAIAQTWMKHATIDAGLVQGHAQELAKETDELRAARSGLQEQLAHVSEQLEEAAMSSGAMQVCPLTAPAKLTTSDSFPVAMTRRLHVGAAACDAAGAAGHCVRAGFRERTRGTARGSGRGLASGCRKLAAEVYRRARNKAQGANQTRCAASSERAYDIGLRA